MFRRFQAASDALRDYLGLVFLRTLPTTITNPPPNPNTNNPPPVQRQPVADAQNASLAQLLAAIPQSERRSDADARAKIQVFVSQLQFPIDHPGWNFSVDFWYQQILRDYELVRIPMMFGSPPSLTPASTRNPANGFLNLREEVVTMLGGDPPPFLALTNPLMRWGVCDFGPTASGDVQHFDLRPRLASGVTGTSPPDVKIQVATVAGAQLGLAALGFDAGEVTGTANSSTTAAVSAFRAARGLGAGGMDVIFQVALDLALREAAVPF